MLPAAVFTLIVDVTIGGFSHVESIRFAGVPVGPTNAVAAASASARRSRTVASPTHPAVPSFVRTGTKPPRGSTVRTESVSPGASTRILAPVFDAVRLRFTQLIVT